MNTILNEAIAEFRDHTIVDGIIRNPGRFEGETVLTVYCDHLEGCGSGGECLLAGEDGGDYASLFDVDDEFRADLLLADYELEPDTVAVLYEVSSSGFVSTSELTVAEQDKVLARAEELAEQEEEETDDDND